MTNFLTRLFRRKPLRRTAWCDSLSPSMGECVLEMNHPGNCEWSKTEIRSKLG